MDSRVILNRVQRNDSISLTELEQLKGIAPELRVDSPVLHRKSVSLIVPTFFNSALKRGSLDHLLSGIKAAECVEEVVLVASDGECESLGALQRHAHGRALTVVSAPPHNRGESRNVGAAAARCEYLLFLDDDMLLKNWRCVDVVLSMMIAEGFECAMFPRRQYARFPLLYDSNALEGAIERWREHGVNGDGLVYDPLNDGTPDLPMLFCFPGCFMLIHRDAFARLAGFNNEFQGWGFEDTEFALRAIRELKVCNLFAKAEPLLHIDHPVSPYKSDEHRENYQKFFGSSIAVDVHRFCRTVLRCSDFAPQQDAPLLGRAIHVEPFTALPAAGVPLDAREIEEWVAALAERRLHALLSPRPEFIVLHGSRASGRANVSSDYDVLCLFRGPVQDFFVTKKMPRVEIECGDFDLFTAIANEPAQFGMHGVLELAKLAQARLLWGDQNRWQQWQTETLAGACHNGSAYWLVLALGLQLHSAKYGTVVERFLGSLRAVLETQQNFATDDLPTNDISRLTASARRQLDVQLPKWRERFTSGRKVFPLQTPEIWSALYALANASECCVETHSKSKPRPVRLPGERYLFAVSSSGLCNRLLLLAGAMRIAKKTNRRLVLHWPDNDQLGCPFEALFKNEFDMASSDDLEFLLRTDRTVKVYNTWRHSGPLYTHIAADGDPDAEVLIIKGWVAPRFEGERRTPEFDAEIARYLRTIVPHEVFTRAVNDFAVPPLTVGVHIRRGDPTREFIDEYRKSEDGHFIAIMQSILGACPPARFFLATDDAPTEARFRELFTDRILSFPKSSVLRHRQAIEEAMMDLLLLGRTAGVIGTQFSTYSEVGAVLGGGPSVSAIGETAGGSLPEVTEKFATALRARAAAAE